MNYGRSEAVDWVRKTLRGYMTALYTPYDGDGAIDLAALRGNVRRTLALPGVGGISVNTLHQEYWTFTGDERRQVVETVIDEVAGARPVIVGCTAPSWKEAAGFAAHAQSAGADLVMVWPSYYGPRGAEGVRAYYEAVAENLDIGMFVYSTTLSELGYYLDPDQVAGLLHIPNVCGVQNTTLNLAQYAQMMRTVGDRIAVGTSLEEYFFFGKSVFPEVTPDFMIGSSRPIFCQTAEQPHCGDFFEAMMQGDMAGATAALCQVMAVADKLQSRAFAAGHHNVSLFKELAGLLGMATGGVRPPLSPPAPAQLAECVEVLVREGMLDRPGAASG